MADLEAGGLGMPACSRPVRRHPVLRWWPRWFVPG